MGAEVVTLADDLRRDEGERLKPYVDTVGKITISVGVNLSDGITQAESNLLFAGRLAAVESEAAAQMPWLVACPDAVQRGVKNMLYNMGWPRLSGFRNMLSALQSKNWEIAATEALDSTWATQVGPRAYRIAALFRGPHV